MLLSKFDFSSERGFDVLCGQILQGGGLFVIIENKSADNYNLIKYLISGWCLHGNCATLLNNFRNFYEFYNNFMNFPNNFSIKFFLFNPSLTSYRFLKWCVKNEEKIQLKVRKEIKFLGKVACDWFFLFALSMKSQKIYHHGRDENESRLQWKPAILKKKKCLETQDEWCFCSKNELISP